MFSSFIPRMNKKKKTINIVPTIKDRHRDEGKWKLERFTMCIFFWFHWCAWNMCSGSCNSLCFGLCACEKADLCIDGVATYYTGAQWSPRMKYERNHRPADDEIYMWMWCIWLTQIQSQFAFLPAGIYGDDNVIICGCHMSENFNWNHRNEWRWQPKS